MFIKRKEIKMKTTIKEELTNMNNNESQIRRGVYQEVDGSFTWITYTRSGNVKKLSTAMKKAGF